MGDKRDEDNHLRLLQVSQDLITGDTDPKVLVKCVLYVANLAKNTVHLHLDEPYTTAHERRDDMQSILKVRSEEDAKAFIKNKVSSCNMHFITETKIHGIYINFSSHSLREPLLLHICSTVYN